MSHRVIVIGVDPGETTGIAALPYVSVEVRPMIPGRPLVLQCDHFSALHFVGHLLAAHRDHVPYLAVEQFVVGGRASRSRFPEAGRITRRLVTELSAFADTVRLCVYPAALVKPWASDHRLEAAGLIDPTKAMGHARDAARHALYTAVHEGIARDPLSKAALRG